MAALQSEVAVPTALVPPPAPAHAAAAEPASEEVTFQLDGVFDGASAWELRHALEQARTNRAGRIVLDFSKVREFYDFGVAVLAYGLAQRAESLPRVILRGLRTHQLRMFRYFGVDADRTP